MQKCDFFDFFQNVRAATLKNKWLSQREKKQQANCRRKSKFCRATSKAAKNQKVHKFYCRAQKFVHSHFFCARAQKKGECTIFFWRGAQIVHKLFYAQIVLRTHCFMYKSSYAHIVLCTNHLMHTLFYAQIALCTHFLFFPLFVWARSKGFPKQWYTNVWI